MHRMEPYIVKWRARQCAGLSFLGIIIVLCLEFQLPQNIFSDSLHSKSAETVAIGECVRGLPVGTRVNDPAQCRGHTSNASILQVMK
jgi:hypothetical protein